MLGLRTNCNRKFVTDIRGLHSGQNSLGANDESTQLSDDTECVRKWIPQIRSLSVALLIKVTT
jgi:hypothetical protein